MKPLTDDRKFGSCDVVRIVRRKRRAPRTDYQYHSFEEARYRGSGPGDPKRSMGTNPPFRYLSEEFLREAKHHFVGESLLFAWITGVSAWGILLTLDALSSFAR